MDVIQLVRVDLFNTLVALSPDRHPLWHTFLGETAPPARVEQAWALSTDRLVTTLAEINTTARYQSLLTVLQACYMEVFAHLQVPFEPEEAARVAPHYHAQRPWLPEAVPWLESMRRHYRLCMASDADEAMVGAHVRQYPFDQCFTSEWLRVYKGDTQNRFFAAIVSHYALAPEQMLHVGDTPAAIVAAQRVGLQTCWVNRTGRSWPHARPPTYAVASLEALGVFLGAAR
jgi:putative hydrolase of the HAD superfamily